MRVAYEHYLTFVSRYRFFFYATDVMRKFASQPSADAQLLIKL